MTQADAQAPLQLAICESRDSRVPLRQGDIFISTQQREHPQLGIVVTSDCDIAQDKAWRSLTWVPIVPVESYAASRWGFDEVQRLAATLRTDLLGAVRKARETKNLPSLSETALDHWLSALSDDNLLLPFQCADDATAQHRLRQKFGPSASALRAASEVLNASPPRHETWSSVDIERVISAIHKLRGAKTPGYKPESLSSIIAQKLTNHPGDVFLLYDLPGLAAEGYVALLRFLRESPADQIGLQAGEAHEKSLPFYRIAALLSPYRYDLTRRLAAVFSDIGLPQQYEDHKRLSTQRVAESLVRSR